jgi:hypothetical protein
MLTGFIIYSDPLRLPPGDGLNALLCYADCRHFALYLLHGRFEGFKLR